MTIERTNFETQEQMIRRLARRERLVIQVIPITSDPWQFGAVLKGHRDAGFIHNGGVDETRADVRRAALKRLARLGCL